MYYEDSSMQVMWPCSIHSIRLVGGGDREWFAGKLASVGQNIGEALSQSLLEPSKWECPLSSDPLQRDPDLVQVIVRLLSGETLLKKS